MRDLQAIMRDRARQERRPQYVVMRYRGNEWGIWAYACNCFVTFGPKAVLQRIVRELNEGGSHAQS